MGASDLFERPVARGDLKPGDKLPSHRELAQKAGVNPNTVQRACREMEQADLVETLRGQGTFVKDNPRLLREIRTGMTHQALAAFIKEMRSLEFRDGEILELVHDGLKGIQESVVQQIQEIEVSMNEHVGGDVMSGVRMLVVGSCTGRKSVTCDRMLTMDDFRGPDPGRLRAREAELAACRVPAWRLYAGLQHTSMMNGVNTMRKGFGRESVAVAIVSAGYGLVAEDQLLVPYEATFNEMGRREALAWSRRLGIALSYRGRLKAPGTEEIDRVAGVLERALGEGQKASAQSSRLP